MKLSERLRTTSTLSEKHRVSRVRKSKIDFKRNPDDICDARRDSRSLFGVSQWASQSLSVFVTNEQ